MQKLTIELTQEQAAQVLEALEIYIKGIFNEDEIVEDLVWLSDLLIGWRTIKTAWEEAPV